jgi:DNA polymerase III epsilon subunit-like protein
MDFKEHLQSPAINNMLVNAINGKIYVNINDVVIYYIKKTKYEIAIIKEKNKDMVIICDVRTGEYFNIKRNNIIVNLSYDYKYIKNTTELYDLVIDLETTGLPKTRGFNYYYSYKNLSKYDSSRLIEIGYFICKKNGDIVKKYEKLIVPDNFKICNSSFHGISNKLANEKGIFITDMFEEISSDLYNTDNIISHNINFDKNVLLSECFRYKQHNLIKIINDNKFTCTWDLAKHIMQKDIGTKLTNLYEFLFKTRPIQKHRAVEDARLCKDCYYKIQENRNKEKYAQCVKK